MYSKPMHQLCDIEYCNVAIIYQELYITCKCFTQRRGGWSWWWNQTDQQLKSTVQGGVIDYYGVQQKSNVGILRSGLGEQAGRGVKYLGKCWTR